MRQNHTGRSLSASGPFSMEPVKPVDFRSQKKNADTKIQPQHQQNYSGQASISDRVVSKIFKVDGKGHGKQGPAARGKYSAWKLAFYGLLFPWKHGINGQKENQKEKERDDFSGLGNQKIKMSKGRNQHEDPSLEDSAEYQKNQAEHAHERKEDGVAAAQDTAENITSPSRIAVDPVQPPLDTQHAPGRGPEGGDGRYREDGHGGIRIKVLNDVDDKAVQGIGHRVDHGCQEIRLIHIGGYLNQGKQKHKKRKRSQDNEKRSLGCIDGHFVLGIFIPNLFAFKKKPDHIILLSVGLPQGSIRACLKIHSRRLHVPLYRDIRSSARRILFHSGIILS